MYLQIFFVTALRGVISAIVFLFPFVATATGLQPQTVKAWEQYLRAVNSRMHQAFRPGVSFLWIDEKPDRAAAVRNGEILVSPASAHSQRRVQSGLIHHWIGAAFIPNATIGEVLSVVRDYDHYQTFYRPTVMNSKAVARDGAADRFSMLLMNKALLVRAALETDYESSYFQLDDRHWYSVAHTTRVQELQGHGELRERRLAENEGTGLIWRLASISRFQERDGGVYVEFEAMALSRDIPVSLRWLVDPLVRRVSRDSLTTALKQTGAAVSSKTARAEYDTRSATEPGDVPGR